MSAARRFILWAQALAAALLLLATTLALAAPLPADEAMVDARLKAISRELRCLVCQNETLADSNAKLAQNLRREVRKLIADGHSDSEVISFLTERYGDFVRYRPPFKPLTWLLWLGPLALFSCGALMLRHIVQRQKQQAAPPPDAATAARIHALLAQQNKDTPA
ncbi:cytochrome c-type biogenesis protein [Craterilacuibacter sp. RT1T]|uniref:cytochrome c-type biogenesis protein n=1 Tax=Craterilacuibacter sp. RT1T TaxID=2942211 RepID=UPI0020C03298|nr:cytochrome c-type biogenesis protein [Craterilacuibacter sp. RT1T]MCL6263833.1 cytochrome c-type biogenesis protein CcmH [Craterilacuibacter sp. RT1T]